VHFDVFCLDELPLMEGEDGFKVVFIGLKKIEFLVALVVVASQSKGLSCRFLAQSAITLIFLIRSLGDLTVFVIH